MAGMGKGVRQLSKFQSDLQYGQHQIFKSRDPKKGPFTIFNRIAFDIFAGNMKREVGLFQGAGFCSSQIMHPSFLVNFHHCPSKHLNNP